MGSGSSAHLTKCWTSLGTLDSILPLVEWGCPKAADALPQPLGGRPSLFPLPNFHPSLSDFLCTFFVPSNCHLCLDLFLNSTFFSCHHPPEGLEKTEGSGSGVCFSQTTCVPRKSLCLPHLWNSTPTHFTGLIGKTGQVLWKLKFCEDYIKGWKGTTFRPVSCRS